MRPRADMSLGEGTVLSKDALKIEICGPEEDCLTVIDLPGIFRNLTEEVTIKANIRLVQTWSKNTSNIVTLLF
jgi:hypothetical protein